MERVLPPPQEENQWRHWAPERRKVLKVGGRQMENQFIYWPCCEKQSFQYLCYLAFHAFYLTLYWLGQFPFTSQLITHWPEASSSKMISSHLYVPVREDNRLQLEEFEVTPKLVDKKGLYVKRKKPTREWIWSTSWQGAKGHPWKQTGSCQMPFCLGQHQRRH